VSMGGVSLPLHSLELLPDESGQDAVRRDWEALRDAGLPTQLDHRSPTNAPHLTVVASPVIGPVMESLALQRLGPLLPLRVRSSGLILFGGRRVTVARAVDVGEELLRAVVALRGAIDDLSHRGWLPHVTLARGLQREHVQLAVDVLGYDDVELNLAALRHWDPETRSVKVLAGKRG